MSMFDEKVQQQLKDVFKQLKNDVTLINFTQEFECPTCKSVREFVEEATATSDKLKFKVYDFVKDKNKANEYNVDKIPAIVLLDKDDNDTGIKYYGLPGGYEFTSFVGSLLEASGQKEELPENLVNRIKNIDKDIHIQVFVLLT